MHPRPAAARRARLAAALVAASISLAGCASDPPTVAPSGVDQLEIPTPSPDPADFVAQVDNPWLPLLPDAEWTFETDEGDRTTLTVTDSTREIAGVSATELRASGGGAASVRWLAQDAAGNVWLFGATEGRDSWEAGLDGAQAALAMPAEPRRGDGWVGADAPGLETNLTAVEVEDDRAVLEARNPQRPETTVTTTYERGTGPVLIESEGPRAVRAELVGFDPGSAAR